MISIIIITICTTINDSYTCASVGVHAPNIEYEPLWD